MNRYEFEQKINAYIEDSGRSQAATARKLGERPDTFNKWVKGINQIPINILHRFCELVQLDENQRNELFVLAGYAVPPVVIEESIVHQVAYSPGIAPPPPRLIVGRNDDLDHLYHRLTGEESTTLLTAMRGWPGVGKTTLAAAAAHDLRLLKAFPDGVLWTALGPEPSVLLALGEWLTALGEDPQPYFTIQGRSNRLAAMLRNKKRLLMVDDVWDAAHAEPFRVGGSDCRILLTTRHPEVARNLGLPEQAIYLLGVLLDDEAVALLRELAPTAVELDPTGTERLVGELEGLPLALQVAGRLLAAEASMGWGVNNLLEELLDGRRILEEKAPADLTNVAEQTTPTVAALFQKSTDRLDTVTHERFALLSIFVSKPATFDAPAAAAAWGIEDARPTLRILVNRGLLEPATEARFQMHALLTTHAQMLSEMES